MQKITTIENVHLTPGCLRPEDCSPIETFPMGLAKSSLLFSYIMAPPTCSRQRPCLPVQLHKGTASGLERRLLYQRALPTQSWCPSLPPPSLLLAPGPTPCQDAAVCQGGRNEEISRKFLQGGRGNLNSLS